MAKKVISGKQVTCANCGWSWSTNDSAPSDKYVCHTCGKDNENATMKNGGWLDAYPEAENGIEGTMGGLTDKGFNYNGAWGGTMQMGGFLPPISLPVSNFLTKGISKVANMLFPDSPDDAEKNLYVLPETINIKDPRKIRKTTGKTINPNVDLVSGEYETGLINEALEAAKEYGLSKEDAWNLAAIGFQESGWGKTDDNIGHIKGRIGEGDTENLFINAYLNKMKEADRLKITDPELRLQVYNGLGVIKPETEQDYHKFKMKKIYGVPVPTTGLSMKKNPLYGRQVIDIRDNVLRKNPEVVKYIESIYGEEPIPQKAMGGSIPGSVGFTYARTNSPAPSNGKYAKKTKASAENGQEMKYYQEGLDWKPKNISQNGSAIPNWTSDLSTRLLNAASTYGGSAIGDAVKGVSPRAADWLNENSMGFIPYTTDEQLNATRAGNPDRGLNTALQASEAIENILAGKLIGAGLGKVKTVATKGIKKINTTLTKKFSDIPKQKNGGWLDSYEEGGVIEDDRGQWAHPGEITKINSNQITMQGVYQDLLGISNTGDVKYMKPGGNYKFKGNSVTEVPVDKINNWLDKYEI